MTEFRWRMRMHCPNGHAYEVPLECEQCDKVEAAKRAEAPPTVPRPPGRLSTWRAVRRARRQLRNF